MDMTFRGAAKRLDDIDLPRIGARIGVGEDEIHAFMDVEAAGSGFDSQGRPKMLFEPHVFWRNLSGSKRAAASKAGLAYPKWGEKPYPKDSYPRLIQAIGIDRTAALMASSWGLTQILGENHRAAGYAEPEAMIDAFTRDEEHHLEATILLLVSMGIDDDLEAHRWQVVARVWNGPGYAKNQYDVKLDRAYRRWAGIPDTPWEGNVTVVAGKARPVLRRGDEGDDVEELQRLLRMNLVDGDFGPATEGAVKNFQLRAGLVADGVVGPKTWAALAA